MKGTTGNCTGEKVNIKMTTEAPPFHGKVYSFPDN